jgi:hypothetical protein
MTIDTSEPLPGQPKRVILQLRVDQFRDCSQDDFMKAIETYLTTCGRSPDELQEQRHFIHLEPFQSDDVPQKYFHIILDMEQDQGPVTLQTLPHELYHIRRSNKGM